MVYDLNLSPSFEDHLQLDQKYFRPWFKKKNNCLFILVFANKLKMRCCLNEDGIQINFFHFVLVLIFSSMIHLF